MSYMKQKINSFQTTHRIIIRIVIIMFDNFVEQTTYHSYDRVYRHPETGNHIYIGDVQSALDEEFLKGNNIKTVVTAARDMDHVSYSGDIKHIVYPLLDGKQENIAVFFDNFYDIVQTNIQKGCILVHCAAGVSRSSTLVISYIMKKQKMSFKDAIAHVRKERPSVLPNLGFERQLKRYEEDLRISQSSNAGNSRNAKRKQLKLNETNKSHFLFRTELMPLFGTGKEKLMSANKITQKDLQVIRTYNRSRNETKNKKFLISKKSSSFTKNYDDLKNGLIVSSQTQKGSARDSNTGLERRAVKVPLQQMKQIYLPRKNHTNFERRFPTERGNTFYNVRSKPKVQRCQ